MKCAVSRQCSRYMVVVCVASTHLCFKMKKQLVSVTNRNKFVIGTAATILMVFSVIIMCVLYEKAVEFYDLHSLDGHISINDIHKTYKIVEMDTFIERIDPPDWEFTINKMYKAEKLNSWMAVRKVEPNDPNQPGEMGKKLISIDCMLFLEID